MHGYGGRRAAVSCGLERGTGLVKAYTVWRRFQERYLQYFAALFLLFPALLSMLEVVRRYGLGRSFPWQQDVITYCILSGTFLFFGITQSRGLHLRVTVAIDLLRSSGMRMSRAIANMLDVFVAAAGLAFCVFLVWRALPVAERMLLTNRMAESQIVPLWPFFITFLCGIALMAISYVFQLYEHIQILRGKDPGLQHGGHGDGADSIL
jgi:TRAP-type C4-dicarboxylate transport system permease small subunit